MKACLPSKPMYCSREYQASTRLIQQYEKSTSNCKSFLGLINYLQPFLPNLASKTTILREQISHWDWNPSADAHFTNLNSGYAKHYLTQHLHILTVQNLLSYRQMSIEYGLGATLLQDGRPIAFVSKTLTDMETGYTNIEHTCLSVCFWLEKIHTYIIGRYITVHNDHKPLKMIQKKNIHTAPPCL